MKAVGTTDPDKVMAELKKTKINDMFAKGGYIRADGVMIHDMYVMQVKTPQESKYPWDYYKVVKIMQGRRGVRAGHRPVPARAQVVSRGAPWHPCRGASRRVCTRARRDLTDLRHSRGRDPRPAHARAGQRLVLRHAEPGAGGDLRPAWAWSISPTAPSTCSGAFAALLGLQWFGIGYWAALLLAPLVVA